MPTTVRPLTTLDLFKVAGMLGKCGDDLKPIIGEITNDQALGFMFVSAGLKYAQKDLREWFADVAGMTVEQLDKQPAVFLIDILEALAAQEDLPGFFERARTLARVLGSGKRLI